MKHSSGTSKFKVLVCILQSERQFQEEALNVDGSRCSELGHTSTLSGTERKENILSQ
jgi:hypothetical protein